MHIDEELFKQKEFKRNLKLYEEAVRTGKSVFMDIDDMTDIIDYYNYDGRVDEADRMADYALSLYPGAIGPLVFKARQAILRGDNAEAERCCEAIEDKADIDYFYLRVELEIAKEDCDAAEALLNEAYPQLAPEDRENFLLDTGALYVDYAMPDLGEKWLNRMSEKDNRERLELMSRIYCHRGDYDSAVKVLERLIDLNPFVCRYWNMLAMIQLCLNQFEDCRNSAEYSLAITPDNTDGLWCRAKALQGLGDAEAALPMFDKFLERIPDCARAEAEKGSCHMQLGQIDEALAILKKAEAHCDDDPLTLAQIYDDLAFAYSNMRNVNLAIQYIEKAEELNPLAESQPGVDYQRMVLKGHVLLQNDQEEKALKMFEEAVKKSKRNPEIIFKVIASLYDHELYGLVVKYFRRLEKVMPEGWNFGYTYAAVSCIKTLDTAAGLKYLKKACLVNPTEVEFLFGNFFPPGVDKEHYYDYIKNLKI